MRLMRFLVRLFDEQVEVEIDRKKLLSTRQVAVTLGISVETLRRWIKNRSFPPSIIHAIKGREDFWLKIDIVEYQKAWLRTGLPTKPRARIKTLDAIDREEARAFSLLVDLDQNRVRELLRMNELMQDEPKQLAREHPNLAQWLKHRNRL